MKMMRMTIKMTMSTTATIDEENKILKKETNQYRAPNMYCRVFHISKVLILYILLYTKIKQ